MAQVAVMRSLAHIVLLSDDLCQQQIDQIASMLQQCISSDSLPLHLEATATAERMIHVKPDTCEDLASGLGSALLNEGVLRASCVLQIGKCLMPKFTPADASCHFARRSRQQMEAKCDWPTFYEVNLSFKPKGQVCRVNFSAGCKLEPVS